MSLPASFFRDNRTRLSALLPAKSIAVVNANDVMPTGADGTFPLHPNADLYYLSGIEQEESRLVVFPECHNDKLREVLFIRESHQHLAIWEGQKLDFETARKTSGIESIKWLSDFPATFRQMVIECERVYLNLNEHSRAADEVESRDMRFVRAIQRQYPLHRYERLAPLLSALRSVKSAPEIETIRDACSITREGFLAALASVKPGVPEREIEAICTYQFVRRGARHAYPPIVASGENACVLHYTKNDKTCRKGDILLLDVGATAGRYNADLTRTVPVSGRFTRRQRQVYDAVLRVHRTMAAAMVPGTSIKALNEQARELIGAELAGLGLVKPARLRNPKTAEAAVRRYFMHGIGHPLGLDVHDVHPVPPVLDEGWVMTCEPGIYIREENLGVRLENDFLITKKGPVDLMAEIPLEADQIEDLMQPPAP